MGEDWPSLSFKRNESASTIAVTKSFSCSALPVENNPDFMTQYHIKQDAGICQITLDGDLTAAGAEPMLKDLQGAIKPGTKEVLFDLTKTCMLDSSGIGLLIATYNSAKAAGGKFRVSNVSADIFQLLQSMRLVTRLNVTQKPS